MKVLVTGATGFVGSSIADELRSRGYDIVGLARSERSADALRKARLDVHRGNIADPESITPALRQVDAVIHTAFNHDFSRYAENCGVDGRLLDALASALKGTNKTLVATSATTVTAASEFATEDDEALDSIPRSASEAFLSYADLGVRTSVVRLPPTVYGAGDTAFIPALIALARERGMSAKARTAGPRSIAMTRHGFFAMPSSRLGLGRATMRSLKMASHSERLLR